LPQLAEGRAHREELLTELADLTTQVTTLQEDLDAKNEKVVAQQAAAEQVSGASQKQLQLLVGCCHVISFPLGCCASSLTRLCSEWQSMNDWGICDMFRPRQPLVSFRPPHASCKSNILCSPAFPIQQLRRCHGLITDPAALHKRCNWQLVALHCTARSSQPLVSGQAHDLWNLPQWIHPAVLL
jgi:hypothetical protein